MSSPLSSVLAQLDESLRAVQNQLDCLGAGLEVNENQLSQAIESACRHSTALGGLILAERPDANWDDRGALENLIQQLEVAAQARRNHQRRTTLVELANELDAGRVKHRFEARTKTLNTLRVQAVKELRTEATLSEQKKELPGPSANKWLSWACNLDDDKDAVILANLRRDFVALESFTGEMDESYWVPGHSADEDSEQPPRSLIQPPGTSAGDGPAARRPEPLTMRSDSDNVSHNVRDVEWAIQSGNYAEAVSICYEAPSGSENLSHSASEVKSEAASLAIATAPSPLNTPAAAPNVKSNGTSSTSTAQQIQASPAIDPPTPVISATVSAQLPRNNDSSVAGMESSGSEEAVEEPRPAGEDEGSAILENSRRRKRLVIAWSGAAGLVLLSVLVAVIHTARVRANSKPATTVASIGAQTSGLDANSDIQSGGGTPGQALDTKSLLHRQPVEGPQAKILLSIEFCDHVNPGGIECWGYVSNVGDQSARVALDRVDVVDSKGNSFSVNNTSQFAFPTGRSSTIPAGSRVKYTVKVPDSDRNARALTLYVDLSNPPKLEYTFRDVPVVN